MKTIIAGSREFTDKELLDSLLDKLEWDITEVVCGKARGADTLGKNWAEEREIPVKPFPADWYDFSPPFIVRTNRYGKKYNALAGNKRNKQMAEYADALIAFWDGKSKGTRDMIKLAEEYNLKVRVFNV